MPDRAYGRPGAKWHGDAWRIICTLTGYGCARGENGTIDQLADLLAGVEPNPFGVFLDDADIRAWEGRLPSIILEIWRSHGLVELRDGMIRLVYPPQLSRALSILISGDPEFGGDTHPIGLSVFGEIDAWSERFGFVSIFPFYAEILVPYRNAGSSTAVPADQQIVESLFRAERIAFEAYDSSGVPMYDRLRERHGRLRQMDVYGATPVPIRAGTVDVEDMVVTHVSPWLEAVFCSMAMTVRDWSLDNPNIRAVAGCR